jgi:hypothetical protein
VVSGGGCSTAVAICWPARIKDKGGLRSQFTHLIDVVPTILEAAGVPAPKVVNGVVQEPLHGVSMTYAFDDAKAMDRRTTQYFELLGGRAIYRDGWWAGTRHGMDGIDLQPKIVPFDEDVWELYDRRSDFGLATDLAPQHPAKLKELQALFDQEAAKYNVYPMGNNPFELLVTGTRAKLVAGNKASYGPGIIRLPEDAVIDVKNRSFSIIAEVESADGETEGVIVTEGGMTRQSRRRGERSGRVWRRIRAGDQSRLARRMLPLIAPRFDHYIEHGHERNGDQRRGQHSAEYRNANGFSG